jgi:hypothetical protein
MSKTKQSRFAVEPDEWAKHVAQQAAQVVKDDIAALGIEVAHIKGKLSDGLECRVRTIEKMQWWQLGIMVTLVGVLIGGLWFMARESSQRSERMMQALELHVKNMETIDGGKGK